MSRIVLRPAAETDLLQACDWYGRERPELADAFVDSFEAVLARIAVMPELYAIALNSIRWCKLRRFPYLVYYRVLSDRIEVIGVLHASRDPQMWQKRVST